MTRISLEVVQATSNNSSDNCYGGIVGGAKRSGNSGGLVVGVAFSPGRIYV